MSVRLVIDSTTDIPERLKDLVEVIPLTITFGGEEYIDGVNMGHKEFYEKLVESDVLPTTSQPSPDAFGQVYERLTANGDDVVVLTISSKLSGTYQSATIAAMDYPGKVYVVDGLNVAIGNGILTEHALHLIEQGMSAEELAKTLEIERGKLCVVALLDTLEYLKRGGRISKTVAFAGGLLSIKPVVTVKDGEIVLLGKARGSKQGNNLLVKEIEAAGGVDYNRPILLGYTGLSDTLLLKYMEDSARLWKNLKEPLERVCVTGVVGTHVGPGAIAVAFFKK